MFPYCEGKILHTLDMKFTQNHKTHGITYLHIVKVISYTNLTTNFKIGRYVMFQTISKYIRALPTLKEWNVLNHDMLFLLSFPTIFMGELRF